MSGCAKSRRHRRRVRIAARAAIEGGQVPASQSQWDVEVRAEIQRLTLKAAQILKSLQPQPVFREAGDFTLPDGRKITIQDTQVRALFSTIEVP